MNFDDIKKSWDTQDISVPKLTEEALTSSMDRLPLDRIRKNTLKDIILQSVSVVGIAFFLNYILCQKTMQCCFMLFTSYLL
ncbi:hypothetical protein QNH98_05195 [Myroides sp. mNGS23_01]|nr:hypothetical protein [Myroides sp. mNGS23_01]WHT40040.1 hypothetical protein QNH98_05195 [Myroides sp. mNGS23_01]